MVRETGQQKYNNTGFHNETSPLESCYLMGGNPSTSFPVWTDESAFQMLGNRPGNTLTEAESLNFDPSTGDTTASDMVSSVSRLLSIFTFVCCGVRVSISTRPPLSY